MNKKPSSLARKNIGVAVIYDNRGQILIDCRRAEGSFGGLWEFPGGKVEPNETIPECIQREIKEELGIDIEVGEHLVTVDHTYSQFHITIVAHCCRHLSGEPQPIECDEIRWVTLTEIEQFTFPEANHKIIAALKNRLARR